MAPALALASLLFAAGCGPRKEAPASSEPPVTPYVSTETGFRFTPPPVWQPERYLVSEVTGPAAAARQPGALSIAEVQYQPIEFANRPEVLLRIHVFSDSAWSGLQHGEGPSLGGVIARARGRTYLASSAQSNPYPAGSKDAQTFDAMRLAIADVKRWLSVADAASDLASEFLPGSPTFGPAPVMYVGFLREAGSQPHRVKVIFRADSSALFSTEIDGRGVYNEPGHWSLEGVYVRLQLVEPGGQPSGRPFIWAIRDSSLAPVSWDRSHYGGAGLPLRLRP